jgi:hypothetical protein
MKNIPYRKRYDENGVLLNPITEKNPYISPFNNRASRRFRKTRFRGNNKRCSLSVSSQMAFHRVIQEAPIMEKDELGYPVCVGIKRIQHYRQKGK